MPGHYGKMMKDKKMKKGKKEVGKRSWEENGTTNKSGKEVGKSGKKSGKEVGKSGK